MIAAPGRTLIPFKRFAEFVNALAPLPDYQADPLVLAQDAPDTPKTQRDEAPGRIDRAPVEDTPLHIYSTQTSPQGRPWANHAHFKTWRSEDYPWVPKAPGPEQGYEMNADALRHALVTCTHFTFETPTFQNCIQLQADDRQMEILAASGQAQMYSVLPLVHPAKGKGSGMFVAFLLSTLTPLLPKEGTVKLSFSHGTAQAYLLIETGPDCFLFVPEADRLGPKAVAMVQPSYATDLLVSRKGLLAALKSATALDRQKKGRTLISLTEQERTLIVSAYPEDREGGASSARVSLEKREGTKIDIHLSWKRFKTLTESFSSELIRLQVGSAIPTIPPIEFLSAEAVPADGTLLLMEGTTSKEPSSLAPKQGTDAREQVRALP